MSPAELAAVAERGLDIQLHTHRHRFRCEDPDDIRQEITVNRDQLEGVAGTDLKHFCYPSGVYDLSHRALLTELGIETATTLDQGINFRGADPLALARLSDGQEVHQLDFEAEISGFVEILRRLRGRQPLPAGALRLGEMLGRAR